jgi:hypothetical protein
MVPRNRNEDEMPRTKRAAPDGMSKFQRYRLRQSRRGMKLLRIWVPDLRQPEFAMEAERQGRLLHDRPEEKEVMDFIADVTEWPEP